jgi:hypothetical protein
MGKFKEIAIEEQQLVESTKLRALDLVKSEGILIDISTSEIIEAFVEGMYSNAAKNYWFNKFKQDVEAVKEQD